REHRIPQRAPPRQRGVLPGPPAADPRGRLHDPDTCRRSRVPGHGDVPAPLRPRQRRRPRRPRDPVADRTEGGVMREPLYDASRAVEDAAAIPGTRPVRLYRIALPLFAVEFDAVVEERRPYDLIDRFIVRSIAEAELRTVPEIAAFLGLEEAMVARALRFLGDVGHVVGRSDGTFALTELGARSVRGTARVVKHDRQKLYFDGV